MNSPKYMRLHRAYLLFIGLWNLERKSVFYRIYRSVMVGYFCSYLFRQLVQLVIIRGKSYNETMKNVGLLITCVMIVLKALVCMNSGADRMIRLMKEQEEKVLQSQDARIINIYNYYVKYNRYILAAYYIVVVSAATFAVCPRILEEHFAGDLGEKELPISEWMIFDTKKYYFTACFIQCIDSAFGSHFLVGSDVFLISFIIFGICQLKILNYSVKNVKSQEDLVKIHKDHLFVIRYVISTK